MHYSPWADAAARHPDVHIERCDIAPLRGAWVPSERVILLDEDLDRPGRRATLAHELSHVDLQHLPFDGWFGRRMERDADSLAARRLLSDVDGIAEAFAEYPCDPRMVAMALDVPLRTLTCRMGTLTNAERDTIDHRVARADRDC